MIYAAGTYGTHDSPSDALLAAEAVCQTSSAFTAIGNQLPRQLSTYAGQLNRSVFEFSCRHLVSLLLHCTSARVLAVLANEPTSVFADDFHKSVTACEVIPHQLPSLAAGVLDDADFVCVGLSFDADRMQTLSVVFGANPLLVCGVVRAVVRYPFAEPLVRYLSLLEFES